MLRRWDWGLGLGHTCLDGRARLLHLPPSASATAGIHWGSAEFRDSFNRWIWWEEPNTWASLERAEMGRPPTPALGFVAMVPPNTS